MKRGVIAPPVRLQEPPKAAPVVAPIAPAARPPRPVEPQPEGDLAVLLSWPAALLLELPRAWTLGCEHESGRLFVVTTSKTTFEEARSAALPAAHGDDWRAMAIAAGQRRACLAVAQWLVPSIPPPIVGEPPDLPPQPLRDALGAPWPLELAPLEQLSVRAVLEHFACRARTLDQPLSLPNVQEQL